MEDPIGDLPPIGGDPDIPGGGTKAGGFSRGVPRGAMQPTFGLVGDESSIGQLWMWRLRAAASSLKHYAFRF